MIYVMWEIAEGDWVAGLLPSLICVIVVFAVLVLISLILSLVNKMEFLDDNQMKTKDGKPVSKEMMAAILVACIDYQKEIKEDVKVVSVEEED